jgi:hypothetical protein
MRQPTDMDEDDGPVGGAPKHVEQSRGRELLKPKPQLDMALRYLELVGGGDVAHEFQPYYDRNRKDPSMGWMARRIYGRLSDKWSKLVELQQQGAAIAVTMAETDGRGRKSVNMLRPRAVWIEADGPLPRELPFLPSIVVETSPGKRYHIFVCRDLDWPLWHGVQQVLITEYGSDRQAGLKTQVLRLPGTLHQKNLSKPHLVRIVEEQTSGQVYTSAEIAVAFPPKATPPPLRVRRRSSGRPPGADWDPERRSFRPSWRSMRGYGKGDRLRREAIAPATKPSRWIGHEGSGGLEPSSPFIMRAAAQMRVSRCHVG